MISTLIGNSWKSLRRDPKLLGQLAYPLTFAAVMASAWYGGVGPGLFAAVIVGLASTYFLLPPIGSFSVTEPGDLLHLGLFALAAVVIGSLQARLQAARRRMEAQGSRPRDGSSRGR